ncbi:hypothetical protein GJ689_05965 [Rhodoplanes serenus]|uniref:Uncharacterized protein n=1 Tax=Rhodoplanes serenus TaxID=200615 RepID=A0A327K7M8_9BRAD|nr:hypothetical protein [Rhodoplanes serenus]MTW15750.1 hypothetical protein [Rhodoplanes serenus]RAI33675.1 hypothetical protein CH340_11480 [Rhodoplanes serenus]
MSVVPYRDCARGPSEGAALVQAPPPLRPRRETEPAETRPDGAADDRRRRAFAYCVSNDLV